MRGTAENALAAGQVAKALVVNAGIVALLVLAGYWFYEGDWVRGLVVLFVLEPIWVFVSDIVTGLLLLPIVGAAHLLGKRD